MLARGPLRLKRWYGPAPVAPGFAPDAVEPLGRPASLPDAADAVAGVDLPGLPARTERRVSSMRVLEEVLRDWEAVIGLEIHAELTTLETKMFCGCKLEFGAPPNTHTCPVCLGLPGALPVPNKAAIESIVLAGLATNCDIERRSMFYRKNYMYPDMAKNFQTTQGPVAFCMRGHLDLAVGRPGGARARGRGGAFGGRGAWQHRAHGRGLHRARGITRIHMEEDAGKMVHVGGGEGRIAGATHSLVDYNRAGTPLIELVTEPDLRTPRRRACSCRSCARSTSPSASPTARWRRGACAATET